MTQDNSAPVILCAGEALIDMLPRSLDGGEAVFLPAAGGAVFNTALALGRLEAPTGFFCALSNDMFGRQLADTLAASSVSTDQCPRVNRPCTLAFVELIDGQASYAFYDTGTAMRAMTTDDLPSSLDHVTTLFMGGISLMGGACADAFEALLTRLPAQTPLMLDPNIRPGFITDEAAYRARLDRMIARADIVKLSDEDLIWLEGDGDISDLAERIRAKGPTIVCITKGSDGVTAYTAAGQVHATAPKATVVDTVGAGDTFNAGLLAGLSRADALTRNTLAKLAPDALQEALALGTAAAAVTVSRAGANPPTLAELGL